MRVIRSSFRHVVILLVALGLATPLIVFGAGHAQAATCDGQSGYSHCVSFNKSWTFNSTKLKVNGKCCIQVDYTLQGYIGYNTSYNSATGATTWKNQTILDPTLTAKVYLCSSSVCSTSTVSKLAMTQYWDGYSCTFNPSFGVSIPWGIVLTAWPNCGDRNVARRSSGYGSGSVFHQYNSGYPVTISNFTTHELNPGETPCYGIIISSTVYEPTSSGSDSDAFHSTNVRKVCLPS